MEHEAGARDPHEAGPPDRDGALLCDLAFDFSQAFNLSLACAAPHNSEIFVFGAGNLTQAGAACGAKSSSDAAAAGEHECASTPELELDNDVPAAIMPTRQSLPEQTPMQLHFCDYPECSGDKKEVKGGCCKRCLHAWYCSKDCQLAHKSKHQDVCKTPCLECSVLNADHWPCTKIQEAAQELGREEEVHSEVANILEGNLTASTFVVGPEILESRQFRWSNLSKIIRGLRRDVSQGTEMPTENDPQHMVRCFAFQKIACCYLYIGLPDQALDWLKRASQHHTWACEATGDPKKFPKHFKKGWDELPMWHEFLLIGKYVRRAKKNWDNPEEIPYMPKPNETKEEAEANKLHLRIELKRGLGLIYMGLLQNQVESGDSFLSYSSIVKLFFHLWNMNRKWETDNNEVREKCAWFKICHTLMLDKKSPRAKMSAQEREDNDNIVAFMFVGDLQRHLDLPPDPTKDSKVAELDACCGYMLCPGTSTGAMKVCQNCEQIKFCSAECARLEWPQHRQFCKYMQQLGWRVNCKSSSNRIEDARNVQRTSNQSNKFFGVMQCHRQALDAEIKWDRIDVNAQNLVDVYVGKIEEQCWLVQLSLELGRTLAAYRRAVKVSELINDFQTSTFKLSVDDELRRKQKIDIYLEECLNLKLEAVYYMREAKIWHFQYYIDIHEGIVCNVLTKRVMEHMKDQMDWCKEKKMQQREFSALYRLWHDCEKIHFSSTADASQKSLSCVQNRATYLVRAKALAKLLLPGSCESHPSRCMSRDEKQVFDINRRHAKVMLGNVEINGPAQKLLWNDFVIFDANARI